MHSEKSSGKLCMFAFGQNRHVVACNTAQEVMEYSGGAGLRITVSLPRVPFDSESGSGRGEKARRGDVRHGTTGF